MATQLVFDLAALRQAALAAKTELLVHDDGYYVAFYSARSAKPVIVRTTNLKSYRGGSGDDFAQPIMLDTFTNKDDLRFTFMRVSVGRSRITFTPTTHARRPKPKTVRLTTVAGCTAYIEMIDVLLAKRPTDAVGKTKREIERQTLRLEDARRRAENLRDELMAPKHPGGAR